ncbi:hypothetical protein [Cutibacterium porci]|uniref:hypothetical protein n=1 Tax=Cutibacterium porci TaxID=2605781 RepID=UPI003898F6EA
MKTNKPNGPRSIATWGGSHRLGSHDYFTFGQQFPEQGLSATTTDPAMIRVPSGLLPGDDLTTALTTGGILLLDPNSESRRVTSSPSLARAVASISPTGASTAQNASRQRPHRDRRHGHPCHPASTAQACPP